MGLRLAAIRRRRIPVIRLAHRSDLRLRPILTHRVAIMAASTSGGSMTDLLPNETISIGSRTGSEEVWRMAREDFLRGDSAAVVCDRYELGKSTFWARESAEGWRRSDARSADVPPILLPDPDDLNAVDLVFMARARLSFALTSGKAAEAATWMKLYKSLRRECADDDLF
jgi:hypothetical protein